MGEHINKVMVLGGRGHLGAYITSSLSKAGFAVTVLSRSSSGASAINDVPVLQSDYTFASLVNAFYGQDAIVCIIPSFNMEDQKKIIDAAVAARVKRFLPNEFGADTSDERLGEMFALFKVKQELVAYLKQKEADGLSWTALCTGSWIDWMLLEGHGLLGVDIKTKTGTLYDSGDQRFTATTISKVGDATAAVLLHPAETKNQYVQVSSFDLTQNIVLETVEKVSRRKFTMEKKSVAGLLTEGQKLLEEGDDGAFYKLVTAMAYSGNEAMYFPEKARLWNQTLELETEETVDSMIEEVLRTCSS